MQHPCEEQSSTGQFGRRWSGESRVEQWQLTDVAEQVSGAPLHGEQKQQDLPIVQQRGALKESAEDKINK